MTLTVNGEQRQAQDGATVAEYLASLGLQSQRVAVERNRVIVPRAEHPRVVLADGDVIEIVHFVGGG